MRDLEEVVIILARGILLHEYAKDLTRYNTKASLEELANERDIREAIRKAVK